MFESAIRRFVDIADLHTKVIFNGFITCYEVGKLAFDLLPIVLSRFEALEGPEAHEVTVCLRSHPPFYLIKNDSLESEKVKAAQAIEDFLKVRF
jgi:hypothetical protein